MTRDTIRDYLGRMVRVEVSAGGDSHTIYLGKVSNYDGDFVTLNPYIFERQGTDHDRSQAKALDKKFKAGTTNSQITIGRRTIDSIEALVFNE